MIFVRHIKDFKGLPNQVYCGRKAARLSASPLANPFYMQNELARDRVCEQYAKWLDSKILAKDPSVCNELNRIYQIHKELNNVELFCYCAPKRCHCDSIKLVLDRVL